jgi:uncharacterized protein YjbK
VASHTEVELKWELSPEAHAALAWLLPQELGPPRRLAQENRFFDASDDRLRRAGMNVRLRREGATVLLTCKRRLPHRHGAHQHDEWERAVDAAIWTRLDQPGLRAVLPLPPHVLAALGDAELAPLGGFFNLRLEFRSRGVLGAEPLEEEAPRDHASTMARSGPRRGHAELLCLDRTDFGARVDHELEIETDEPKESSERWAANLRDWRVAWKPQARTKFARYLELRG